MKRDLPAYVYPKGRKGYLYYCRRGAKPVRMYQKPGTPEFAAEYAMLLKGRQPTPARTMKRLIGDYMASYKWKRLAKNTQRSYGRHFAFFEDVMGNVDPGTLRRVHVNQMRDELSDTPTDANRKVGALSTLLEHAIDKGWLSKNEAKGVERLKGKRPDREPWPEDKIEKFRQHADARTLLIFELLLGTGQRIGDVLAMKWADIEDGGIRVKQEKTKAALWVPFTPTLSALLEATPRLGDFIVSQDNGKPMSYQLAHRDIMRVRKHKEVRAEGWDIHSLRHSAASEIASIPGMTFEHVRAITGHTSEQMAKLYSGKAHQKARAREVQNAWGTKPEPGNGS